MVTAPAGRQPFRTPSPTTADGGGVGEHKGPPVSDSDDGYSSRGGSPREPPRLSPPSTPRRAAPPQVAPPPSSHEAAGAVVADASRENPEAFHGVSGTWSDAKKGPPLIARLQYAFQPTGAGTAPVNLAFDITFDGAAEMTAEVAKHLLYAIHCGRTFTRGQALRMMEITLGKTLQESVVKVNGEKVATCSMGSPNLYRPKGQTYRDTTLVLSTMHQELAYHIFKAWHASNPAQRSRPIQITVNKLEEDERLRLMNELQKQAAEPSEKRPKKRNGQDIPRDFLLTDPKKSTFDAGASGQEERLFLLNGPRCYGCAGKVRRVLESLGVTWDIWFLDETSPNMAVRIKTRSDTDLSDFNTVCTQEVWDMHEIASKGRRS